MGAVIAANAAGEARIAGHGTSEAEWQAGPFLRALPRVELDTVLGNAARLVVLAPHPDDEVLGCGGLMQLAVARGMPVRVLSISDGEACYPGHPHWTPARLRNVRRAELHAALACLGIDSIAVAAMGVADGGVAAAVDAVATALHGMLRDDDLVLAPWRDDGHPDHEAAWLAAAHACDRSGSRLLEYPVWGWHWMDARGTALRYRQAMQLRLPGATRRAKREAIACFSSQTGTAEPRIAAPILPPHVLARFDRDAEVFIA